MERAARQPHARRAGAGCGRPAAATAYTGLSARGTVACLTSRRRRGRPDRRTTQGLVIVLTLTDLAEHPESLNLVPTLGDKRKLVERQVGGGWR